MLPRYHPMKAFVTAIGNAIPLVILPVYFLRALPTYLPVEIPLDLQALERTIITFGGVAVIFAALTAFFSKGLVMRAAFGSARQGSRVAWIYYVLSGGIISLSISLFDADVSFGVNVQRLLYILYAAILLMVGYFIAEYFVYRREFQEEEYYEY